MTQISKKWGPPDPWLVSPHHHFCAPMIGPKKNAHSLWKLINQPLSIIYSHRIMVQTPKHELKFPLSLEIQEF